MPFKANHIQSIEKIIAYKRFNFNFKEVTLNFIVNTKVYKSMPLTLSLNKINFESKQVYQE